MSTLYWLVVVLVVSGMCCLEYGRRTSAAALRVWREKYRDLESRLAGRQASFNASELRYKLLFNDVSAAIIITRFSGEIVAANTAMVQLLGYDSEDDLRKHNAAELYVDPAVREAEMKHLSSAPHNHNREFPLRRKDGNLIKVLVTGRVLPVESGAPSLVEGIFTDVTQLRRVEERCDRLEHGLKMTQKQRAMGTLAAGVAHEINTPLQYISDSVHVLMLRMQDLLQLAQTEDPIVRVARATQLEPQISRALERTVSGIGSVTRIVRAMKEFSYPDKGPRVTADLNQALRTTLTVCRNEYRHIAEIETDLHELPGVWCHVGDLNQAFLNLIVNAAHAIEAAGRGRGTIKISSRPEPGAISVTIADTGCGIPESLRHRIFDPFFTTKPIGKGTGQGLAIVRAIIDQHFGEIHVSSAPGEGTSFTIRLPVDSRTTERPPELKDQDQERVTNHA
jgi:PAS domain S-box-containing protein